MKMSAFFMTEWEKDLYNVIFLPFYQVENNALEKKTPVVTAQKSETILTSQGAGFQQELAAARQTSAQPLSTAVSVLGVK